MKQSDLIYLDNNATTQLDPRVFEAMEPWISDYYANPSSAHGFGDSAEVAVEESREIIASCLGCSPAELIFTSGATESVNLAIRGILESALPKKYHLVTSAMEHSAVLQTARSLARSRAYSTRPELSILESDSSGIVEPEQVEDSLADHTALVSIMHVNNETGLIQPVEKIGEVCIEKGIPFHSDATQSVGKLPVNFHKLPVDALSFSAHKFHGPKGIGALIIRKKDRRIRLTPQITGGGQERNLRSGTLNVPGIIGMAAALKIACDNMDVHRLQIQKLRDLFLLKLKDHVPDFQENGSSADRLYNTLNLYLPGVESVALLNQIPEIALSTGSACKASVPGESHVITSMFHASGEDTAKERARSTIRVGFSRFNTKEEVMKAANRIGEVSKALRQLV